MGRILGTVLAMGIAWLPLAYAEDAPPPETVAPAAPIPDPAQPAAPTPAVPQAEPVATPAPSPVPPAQGGTADATEPAPAPPTEGAASIPSPAEAVEPPPVSAGPPVEPSPEAPPPPVITDQPPPPPVEPEPPQEPTPAQSPQNRMHFILFGGVDVPFSGEKVGGGMGGVIGYDFFDRIGIELLLSQVWGETSLSGKDASLQTLGVRPGVRYRYLGGEIRGYIMGHLGLAQVKWADQLYNRDNYDEGFSFDAGTGVEFRIANIFVIDLLGMYQYSLQATPQNAAGNLGDAHGLFVGLGLGVSSTL